MSLILDALRKSDQQRARNASERLRAGPGVAAPARSPMRSAVVAALLLLAALTAAIALRVLTADRAATGTDHGFMENVPVTRHAPVRPLREELARAAAPAPVVVAQPRTAASETARRPDEAISEDDLRAPPLAALPAEIRAQLPQLHMDIHAWAEEPGARFVLINLRRYREGDRLQEGPFVQRILPDGVVLEHNGTRFSLPRQ